METGESLGPSPGHGNWRITGRFTGPQKLENHWELHRAMETGESQGASPGHGNTMEDVEDKRKTRKGRMVDEEEYDARFVHQHRSPLLKVPFHITIF
jgi:hypothetical protein